MISFMEVISRQFELNRAIPDQDFQEKISSVKNSEGLALETAK